VTVQTTLVLSTLFALVSAGIYLYLGRRLSRRSIPASPERTAWLSFTLWWYGLAVTSLIGGTLSLLGALGLTNLAVFVTATYINLQVSCLALLGLFYYLTFLFTGNSRWLGPLAVLYSAASILLVYFVTASEPLHVTLEPWRAALEYRTPPTTPFIILLIVFLFASQIVGGFAYFTLYFRMSEPTQKYRILLVSWSIISWFLTPFIGIAGGLTAHDWWQVVSRLIGLIAALTVLLAYWPPGWVQQRYGVLSLLEENQKA
jgi:hypothetical protein